MAAETEWTIQIKACTSVSLSAILGGSSKGCVIYDKTADAVSAEFQICGGIIVGVALKVGPGFSVGNQKVVCAKAKISVPLNTHDKIKDFLTSGATDSKEARGLFKQELLQGLKQMGVPQSDLDGVERVEFGPFFIDGAGRELEIKQEFERCVAPGSTPVG